jgi:hypothetical protein
MRLEARRVTARCELSNCLAKQITIKVGGFVVLPATNGRSPPRRIERLRHKGSALQFRRDLRIRRDKRGGGSTCWRGRAGVVPK